MHQIAFSLPKVMVPSASARYVEKLPAVARMVQMGITSSAINATVRCAAAKAGGEGARGGEAGKREGGEAGTRGGRNARR